MPVQLSAEDFEKLESKKLANIIRKLHAGKTPTAAEQAILNKARAGGDTSGPRFAKNWDELADALGVSRRQLQNWRNDPRYQADAPKCAPDGRKEIALWMAWTARHGLKSSAPLNDVDDSDHEGEEIVQPPKLGGTVADWKAWGEKLKGEKLELELEKQRENLLVANELEIPLGATLVAITSRVTQLPEILAPLVVGQLDVPDIMEIIRPETDGILAALNVGDYIAEVDLLVGDLPTDPETTQLLKLVTFTGQDAEALRRLLAHLLKRILSRIGREAITRALRPPVTDDVTGQTLDQTRPESELLEIEQTEPTDETSRASGKSPHPKADAADHNPKEIPAAALKNRPRSKQPATTVPKVSRRRSSPKPKPKPRKKK